MAASKQNRVLFSLLKQALTDQQNPDWVFKTSIMKARGFEQKLEADPILTGDKVEDLFLYVDEVKPYHTKFETKIELKRSSEDSASLQVDEFPEMNLTLMYDRVAVQPDSGLSIPLSTIQFRNAANRIAMYYSSAIEELDYRELLDANFKGIQLNGGTLYHDRVGFDDFVLLDSFTGDGVTTTFSTYIHEPDHLVVRVNGVNETPTITASGITFSVPPVISSTIELLYGVTQAYFEQYGFDSPTKVQEHQAVAQTSFSKPPSDFNVQNLTVYYDGNLVTRDQYTVTDLTVEFNAPVTGVIQIVHIDHDILYDRVLHSGAFARFARARIKGTTNAVSVNVNGTNGLVIQGTPVIFTGTGTLASVINDINAAGITDIVAFSDENFLCIGSTTEQTITVTGTGPNDNMTATGLLSQVTEFMDTIYSGDGFVRPQYSADRPEELSVVRIQEGTDIRVYTKSISITAEPGFDDDGFDTSGFDSGSILVNGLSVAGFDEEAFDALGFDFDTDQDAFLGNGPGTFTQVIDNPTIGMDIELAQLPFSNDSIFVFLDGNLVLEGAGYTVDWSDPGYGDPLRDDRITNPRIQSLVAGLEITIVGITFGGSSVERQIRLFDHSVPVIDTGVDLSVDIVHCTVDGVLATVTVAGTIATITAPPVLNSNIVLTVFGSDEYTDIQVQDIPSGTPAPNLIPSDPTPSYKNTLVFDTDAAPYGLISNYPFIKLQRSNGTTVYESSVAALSASTRVLVDSIEMTDVTPAVPTPGEFRRVGSTVELGDIPTDNVDILIIDESGADFTLTQTTDPFDTITSVLDVKAVTFNSLRYSGLTIECFEGVLNSESSGYELGRKPFDKTEIVFVNGQIVNQGPDFYLDPDDSRTIKFVGNPTQVGDRVTILYDAFRKAKPSVAFRLTQDNQGVPQVYRIADQHTGELTSALLSTDTEFFVKEGTHLGQPTPAGVTPRIPGAVFIGSERIEYFAIDYSVVPHRIWNLRRGTWNTGVLDHPIGTKVIDGSLKQKSPVRLLNDTETRLRYHLSTGVARFSIPGEVRDPNDIRVWSRDLIELKSNVTESSTSVTVSDFTGLLVPGPTELLSNASPAGTVLLGDAFNITVQLSGSTAQETVLFTIDGSAQEAANIINASSVLTGVGVTAEVQNDILLISSEYGCQFTLSNAVGYPLQSMFGGSAIGSNLAPVVTVDALNGLTVQGVNKVYTGTGDISAVVSDLNSAGIPNVTVRNRAGYIEIIHLLGSTLTLADIDVGEDSLAILGLAAAYGSTHTWNLDGTISGTRSLTVGSVWLQNDRIEFKAIDVSGSDPVLFDFNTFELEVNHLLGESIQVTTFRELTGFTVQSSEVVFGSVIPSGTVIRVQNRDLTGRLVVPPEIQSSTSVFARFLQARPGTIQEI